VIPRLALTLLAIAAVAIPVVSFTAAAWAGWAFALLSLAFPIALMSIGAARRGRVGWLGGVFVGLLALLVASGVAVLLHAGADASDDAWFGLPSSFVAFALGVWIVPFAITIAAYALSFAEFGISNDDLDRLGRLTAPRDDE